MTTAFQATWGGPKTTKTEAVVQQPSEESFLNLPGDLGDAIAALALIVSIATGFLSYRFNRKTQNEARKTEAARLKSEATVLANEVVSRTMSIHSLAADVEEARLDDLSPHAENYLQKKVEKNAQVSKEFRAVSAHQTFAMQFIDHPEKVNDYLGMVTDLRSALVHLDRKERIWREEIVEYKQTIRDRKAQY